MIHKFVFDFDVRDQLNQSWKQLKVNLHSKPEATYMVQQV